MVTILVLAASAGCAGAQFGSFVSVTVDADQSYALLRVTSRLGVPHRLLIEVDKGPPIVLDHTDRAPQLLVHTSDIISRLYNVGTPIAVKVVAVLFSGGDERSLVLHDASVVIKQGRGAGIQILAGYDYTLPEWVEQTPGCALIANGPLNHHANIIQEDPFWAVTWVPKWSWIQPTDSGIWNWQVTDAKYAAAESGGYGIDVSLYMNVVNGLSGSAADSTWVPDWVFDPVVDRGLGIDRDLDTFETSLEVYLPVWHEGLQAAQEALIDAFISRYKDSPAFFAIRIGGVSDSTGEEWSFGPATADSIYAAGGTSDGMVDWAKGRIDAYASALGDDKHRASWAGTYQTAWWFSGPDDPDIPWRHASRVIARYVEEVGVGQRHGNIEYQWYKRGMPGYLYPEWPVGEPRISAAYDSTFIQRIVAGPVDTFDYRHGYLWADDDHPRAGGITYYGDENEEYGHKDSYVNTYGPAEDHPDRYHQSMYAALQMRMRQLWVNRTEWPLIEPGVYHGIDYDRPLTEYVKMSLGKTIDDSPDAFTRLLSAPASSMYIGGQDVVGYNSRTGVHLMRNMERWIWQRDVPAGEGTLGGITVPVDKRMRAYNSLTLSGDDQWITALKGDYFARRTDVATDNPAMYFHVRDGFSVSDPVEVRVTYRDAGTGTWRLDYETATGVASTGTITNTDSGDMMTAVFLAYGLTLTGYWESPDYEFGFNLRLFAEDDDLHVYLVRLTRWLDGPLN